MNLLLTNDDGYQSPGLAALLRELHGDHRLYVSAPDRQRSAAGAAMTIHASLTATPVTYEDYADVPAFAVSGTPVDCARIGFGHLFTGIDAVLSGINLGPNCGSDVIYSGTCSAAQEAAMHGYPALALSLDGRHDGPFIHFETAARLARRGLDLLQAKPLPFGAYYSINVPDLPFEALQGIRYGHLGKILYGTTYEERREADGTRLLYECSQRLPSEEGFRDTDEYWLARGYATVTALGFDCAFPLHKAAEQEIIERLKGNTP